MAVKRREQAFAGLGPAAEDGLRVVGTSLELLNDHEAALGLEGPAALIPCWGMPDTLVDRFDARRA